MAELVVLAFDDHANGAWVAFGLLFVAIPIGLLLVLSQALRGKGRWSSSLGKWTVVGVISIAALVLAIAYRDMFWNRFFEVRFHSGQDPSVEFGMLLPTRTLRLHAAEIQSIEQGPGTRGMAHVISVTTLGGRVLRSPDLSDPRASRFKEALGSFSVGRSH